MGRHKKGPRAKIHINMSFQGRDRVLQEAKARGGLDFGQTVEAIVQERDNILQVSIEQRNLIDRFFMPEIRDGRVLTSLLGQAMDERLAFVCPFHCGYKGKDSGDIWKHVYEKHPFQMTGETKLRGPFNVSSAYVKKTMNILEGKSVRFQEDEAPFFCKECDAGPFKTKAKLKEHYKIEHPEVYQALYKSGKRVA